MFQAKFKGRSVGVKILAILVFSTVVLSWLWLGIGKGWHLSRSRQVRGDAGGVFSLFSNSYPADPGLREELARLRQTGRLKPENEILLNRSILAASEKLRIPPAVLWCLFFQESRLNHLEGIEGDRGARGLGQFSYFSFYEINHSLTRYTPDNLSTLTAMLGYDVRPVEPRTGDLTNPSSYFFIPTAVATSAAYLNNRYHQIRNTLEKRGISYDRDLLWFYSAMAYNKGSRTVLNFLDTTRKTYGNRRQERLLIEKDTLFRTLKNTKLLGDSLKRIWPSLLATQYATELKIHMDNMHSCTMELPGKSETSTQLDSRTIHE